MLRKTSAAAAVIAFATVGSALFGGAALANGHGDHDGGGKDEAAPTFTGGAGGAGGDAETVCFIVGDQTFKDKNTVGAAPGSLACTSTGGNGGAGGAGAVEY
jgi:hypothetical protein